MTFDPVWIGAKGGAAAESISKIQIEPVSVVPRTDRPSIGNIR